MNKSSNIIGALTNKGANVFRETFKHSTKDVTHYFPSHMAKGEHVADLYVMFVTGGGRCED